MTLPHERKNAIRRARLFLLDICKPNHKISKKDLRREVYSLLKHYPGEFELEQINRCKKCREIIGGECSDIRGEK